MEHRAQVPVQCPVCNWRHFLEVEVEDLDLAAGTESASTWRLGSPRAAPITSGRFWR